MDCFYRLNINAFFTYAIVLSVTLFGSRTTLFFRYVWIIKSCIKFKCVVLWMPLNLRYSRLRVPWIRSRFVPFTRGASWNLANEHFLCTWCSNNAWRHNILFIFKLVNFWLSYFEILIINLDFLALICDSLDGSLLSLLHRWRVILDLYGVSGELLVIQWSISWEDVCSGWS